MRANRIRRWAAHLKLGGSCRQLPMKRSWNLRGSPLVRSNKVLEAEAAARALTMLERWGKLIRMPSKDMLTEAAQALDSENVRCRDPEDQKFLILTKAAVNICGVGSTALITRDKLLRKSSIRSSGLPSAEARCCSFPKTSPNKAFLIEDIPDHAYDSIDDPESTGGKAEPNKNSNDAGSHEISQDLWRKPHHTRLRADWESTLKLPIFHFSRQYIPHLYRG